jgi:hypothetical protein
VPEVSGIASPAGIAIPVADIRARRCRTPSAAARPSS